MGKQFIDKPFEEKKQEIIKELEEIREETYKLQYNISVALMTLNGCFNMGDIWDNEEDLDIEKGLKYIEIFFRGEE